LILKLRVLIATMALYSASAAAEGIRIIDAPRRLVVDSDTQTGIAKEYHKGELMFRAYIQALESARLASSIDLAFGGPPRRIGPDTVLTKAFLLNVRGSFPFAQSGTFGATGYCEPGDKRPNGRLCLFDLDADGRFEVGTIVGGTGGAMEPSAISPIAYHHIEGSVSNGDRLEFYFRTLKGQKVIVTETLYYLSNKEQAPLRLFIVHDKGIFDYSNGGIGVHFCFFRADRGHIALMGMPITTVHDLPAVESLTASLGTTPANVSLFVADHKQRWMPKAFRFCGRDESDAI
jgi:hypothetical protein